MKRTIFRRFDSGDLLEFRGKQTCLVFSDFQHFRFYSRHLCCCPGDLLQLMMGEESFLLRDVYHLGIGVTQGYPAHIAVPGQHALFPSGRRRGCRSSDESIRLLRGPTRSADNSDHTSGDTIGCETSQGHSSVTSSPILPKAPGAPTCNSRALKDMLVARPPHPQPPICARIVRGGVPRHTAEHSTARRRRTDRRTLLRRSVSQLRH